MKDKVTFAQLAVIFSFMPFAILYDGWVLMKVFNWLIAPIIDYQLILIYAIGISTTISMLKPQKESKKEGDTWDKLIKTVAEKISLGLFYLAIAYIINLFY